MGSPGQGWQWDKGPAAGREPLELGPSTSWSPQVPRDTQHSSLIPVMPPILGSPCRFPPPCFGVVWGLRTRAHAWVCAGASMRRARATPSQELAHFGPGARLSASTLLAAFWGGLQAAGGMPAARMKQQPRLAPSQRAEGGAAAAAPVSAAASEPGGGMAKCPSALGGSGTAAGHRSRFPFCTIAAQ